VGRRFFDGFSRESADRLEKFTELPLMVGDLTDGGLNHYEMIIEADDDTSGIHNMVILKYLHRIFMVKGLLKVPVGQQFTVFRHTSTPFMGIIA
jgi:hypothetical protein